jgi:two-component system, NarL family, invasion response regulator UvrY
MRTARLIRALIADANMLIRTGLRSLLVQLMDAGRDICEIDEAASGAQVLGFLREHAYRLCLLDVSLPERGGLEILRHLRKAGGATRVLFLAGHAERHYAPEAQRLGAAGFLLKDCGREELLAALRSVIEGGSYMSPKLSQQPLGGDEAPAYSKLSQREFQIFQKLARGTAITEIGRELSISPKSVSTYRSRILEKMHCRNNAEITQYAMRVGLI